MDRELSGPLATFASPLKIMQKFGTSGADGLAVSYRKPDSAAPDGTETLFALQVAQFRDGLDPKRQAMLDVVWRPGSRHVVVAVAGTRPFVGRGGGEGSGAGAAGDNVKGLHPVSADRSFLVPRSVAVRGERRPAPRGSWTGRCEELLSFSDRGVHFRDPL